MMHILLDTNPIISDGFGRSANFNRFLELAHEHGITVYVPSVVLDEVVGRFAKDLSDSVEKANAELAFMSRRVARDLGTFNTVLDVNKEVGSFRSEFSTRLAEAGVAVPQYPIVSHRDVTDRAIYRRKPFRDKGVGYRDTLIWLTALELADQVEDNIVLVTNNIQDFGDGSTRLHGQLQEDLENRGHERDKVALVTSIKDVVQQQIGPYLRQTFFERPSETLENLDFDAEHELTLAIESEYSDRQWTPVELGLVSPIEALILDTVEEVTVADVRDTRDVEDGRVSCVMISEVVAVFQGFMPEETGDQEEPDSPLTVVDQKTNEHHILVATRIRMRCESMLTFDPLVDNAREVYVRELRPLRGP